MTTPSAHKDALDQAASLIKQGDIAQGEQILRRILQIDPNSVLALLWMTRCTKDPSRKAALFERVLALDPDNPHALKGIAFYGKGRKRPTAAPTHHTADLSRAEADALPSNLSRAAPPSAERHDAASTHPALAEATPSAVPPSLAGTLEVRPFTQQPPPSSSRDKIINLAIAVTGGLLVIAVALIVISSLGGPSKEFRQAATTFLLEGGKLDAMTSQGVSIGDFANQLAQVKSSYRVLAEQPGTSLATSQSSFDAAIQGWDLVLDVWHWSTENNADYLILDMAPSNVGEIQRYLGNQTPLDFISVEKVIGTLMSVASSHFERGRGVLKNVMQ